MCLEHVDVAICAPISPPALTFTCGKLHLVASNRQVCDKAISKCKCFFGTCGTVEKIASTQAIDLCEITKVRCVSCTSREDQVGDRRHGIELIDSPLLQRNAVTSAAALQCFRETLNEIWGGAETCPFHIEPEAAGQATSSDSESGNNTDSTCSFIEVAPATTQRPSPTCASATVSHRPVTPEEVSSGIKLNMGLATSRWARASTITPPARPRRANPHHDNPPHANPLRVSISQANLPQTNTAQANTSQTNTTQVNISQTSSPRASPPRASPPRTSPLQSSPPIRRSKRIDSKTKALLDSAKQFLERA